MAILTVIEYPDPRLRIKAKTVLSVDAETQQQLKNMIETMYHDHGGGLAATQVDIPKRMFVMDGTEKQKQPLCFVNPEILAQSGELLEEEGCLSFPGITAKVKRFSCVTVKALDFEGRPFEITYEDDYCCRCVQHEIDHLNGIVFLDYLSPLKRSRAEKKLKKYQKELM